MSNALKRTVMPSGCNRYGPRTSPSHQAQKQRQKRVRRHASTRRCPASTCACYTMTSRDASPTSQCNYERGQHGSTGSCTEYAQQGQICVTAAVIRLPDRLALTASVYVPGRDPQALQDLYAKVHPAIKDARRRPGRAVDVGRTPYGRWSSWTDQETPPVLKGSTILHSRSSKDHSGIKTTFVSTFIGLSSRAINKSSLQLLKFTAI